MKTLRQELILWMIILSPIAFSLLNWEKFPEQVPIHFNYEGQPDDFASRTTGLVLLPGINALIYFLFLLVPRLDPKRKAYDMLAGKWTIIRGMFHSFMSFISFITAFVALGYEVNVGLMVCLGIVTLFLVLGNYMGNIRQNYTMGIRLPWTLNSENNWTHTHRFTSRIWVFSSLLMYLFFFFFPGQLWALAPYMILLIAAPVIYSYAMFKKEQQKQA